MGRTEQALLLALQIAKGGELSTAEIQEVLSDKRFAVTLGTLYPTLDRAVKKQFISRRKGDPLPERGGKARVYYKLTNIGRAALIEANRTSEAIHSLTLVSAKK
ncbi:PadR family transcriptional regulator [Bradyrhizobium sp. CCGUVB1N3]|uniref:PadR family transcriptional regulator n=1 Tax=Bradyrhizobium sp. CCGUVB1N3 TaxID=2949629 RepID=UPI0020B1AA0E|nr:helix-turn-helix transcriptional regulator [Bradyrhizobium sp. CCGUVB1N3]MCP3477647.1 PadR family transcriptional regulator [Bradyrhizobium sp. CCGUVB1N3]